MSRAQEEARLDRIPPGKTCVVIGVDGDDSVTRRLIDTGMVPNAEIQVIRRALWGDPTQYCLEGFRLALRKEQASRVRVRLEESRGD